MIDRLPLVRLGVPHGEEIVANWPAIRVEVFLRLCIPVAQDVRLGDNMETGFLVVLNDLADPQFTQCKESPRFCLGVVPRLENGLVLLPESLRDLHLGQGERCVGRFAILLVQYKISTP